MVALVLIVVNGIRADEHSDDMPLAMNAYAYLFDIKSVADDGQAKANESLSTS